MSNPIKMALIGAAIVGTAVLVGNRMNNLQTYIKAEYEKPVIVGYDFWSAGDGCALNLKFVAQDKTFVACGEVLNSNIFVKSQT